MGEIQSLFEQETRFPKSKTRCTAVAGEMQWLLHFVTICWPVAGTLSQARPVPPPYSPALQIFQHCEQSLLSIYPSDS